MQRGWTYSTMNGFGYANPTTEDAMTCHARIDDTYSVCTREEGHEGEHRCSVADVDARKATTSITHTPGPWRFKGMTCYAGNRPMFTLSNSLGSDGVHEHEANADVIEAAPDLLDAVCEVLNDSKMYPLKARTFDLLMAAAAKAAGRKAVQP